MLFRAINEAGRAWGNGFTPKVIWSIVKEGAANKPGVPPALPGRQSQFDISGSPSSKGQATIPKAVRERLHLKPGDRFKFFFHPDGVIILPKIPTSRLKGIIPKPAKPVSLEEIDAAVEAGATHRFRQKK
jgi:antitoxin PrlF